MKPLHRLLVSGLLILGACAPPTSPPEERKVPAAPNSSVSRLAAPGRLLVETGLNTSFGNTSACGSTVALTVTNKGTAPLTLSGYAIDAPFSVGSIQDEAGTAQVLPFTLGIGKRSVFTLKFKPRVAGFASGTFRVKTDDPAEPSPTVPLSGTGTGPLLVVHEQVLPFGNQSVGQPKVKELSLWNTGDADLTVHVRASPPFTTVDSLTIPQGENRPLSVTFTPASKQPYAGMLTLADAPLDNPGSICSRAWVDLTGAGTTPGSLELNHSELTFLAQAVNTTSDAQFLTVSNKGDELVRVDAPALVLDDSFKIDPAGTFSLAPGGEKKLALRFRPSSAGPKRAELRVNLQGATTPPLIVELKGDAVELQPSLSFTPKSLSFENQRAGVQSEPVQVSVFNRGSKTMKLKPLTAGRFVVSPSVLEVPAGRSESFQVTFNPLETDAGLYTDNLLFTLADGSNSEPDPSLGLQGIAVRTRLSLDASSNPLDFGEPVLGSAVLTREAILHNYTSLPVTVIAVNPPNDLFTLDTALPMVIPGKDFKPLRVRYNPSRAGNASHVFSIQTDAVDTTPLTLTVKGTALAPALRITPGDLSFDSSSAPSTKVGAVTTREIVLENSGTSTLVVKRAALSDGTHFELPTPAAFQLTLEKGQKSNPIQVRFKPLQVGIRETRLNFYDSGDTLLATSLLMHGTGSGPSPLFEPADELKFGDQRLGVRGTSKVKISNARNATEALQILWVTADPPFSVEALPAGGVSVGADAKAYELTVYYQPTGVGFPEPGTLRIQTNSGLGVRELKLIGNGVSSKVKLSSVSADFKGVELNRTKEIEITLENPGSAELTLKSAKIKTNTSDITDADRFTHDLPWPMTLPAKKSIMFKVYFTPTKKDSISANLELLSNAEESTVNLLLSGQGASAVLSGLDATRTYKFAPVRKGQTSSLSMTLKNIGYADLLLNEIAPSGVFSVKRPTKGWPLTLRANEESPLEFVFTPNAKTLSTGQLILTSNSINGAVVVKLEGEGVAPDLAVSDLDFSNRQVGSISTDFVTLSNNGNAELHIQAIIADSPFCFISDSECRQIYPSPVNILPGGKATLAVSVKPAVLGSSKGKLTFDSDTDKGLTTANLAVNGTGGLFVSQGLINVGSTTSSRPLSYSIDVTNSGLSPEKISSFEFDNPDDFSVESVRPITVDPSKTEPIKVFFHPQGPVLGSRETTMRIMTATPGRELNVKLQGNLVSPDLSITEEGLDATKFNYQLDFKGVPTETSSLPLKLKLTNTSKATGALNLTAKLEGDDKGFFSLDTESLTDVRAGGSAPLSVQFRPTATREYHAVLRLTSDDLSRPIVLVTLRGYGLSGRLLVDSQELNFNKCVVGSEPERTLTITNRSAQIVTLKSLDVAWMDDKNVQPSHYSARVDADKTLPYSIPPGGELKTTVVFHPRAGDTSVARLLVVSDDVKLPVQEVKLSGQGASTVFQNLASTVDFKTRRLSPAPATLSLQLTNDTDQAITLRPPVVEGTHKDWFAVLPREPARTSLAPGESQLLDIQYDTTQVSESQATLVLGIQGTDRAAKVSLQGKTVVSFLSVDTSGVDFGWVDAGSTPEPRVIMLTNISDSALRVSLLGELNPVFQVDSGELLKDLLPGKSMALTVRFAPTEGGEYTDRLRLRVRGEESADVSIDLGGKLKALGSEGGGYSCEASGGGPLGAAWLLLVALGAWRRSRHASA